MAHILPDEAINIANEQRRNYATAIGRGVKPAIIEDVRAFAESAPTNERFIQHADILFVYEMLVMEGGHDKILDLINLWVEDDDNVDRAARHVQRESTVKGQALISAFCLFRLKHFEGSHWGYLDDHGAEDLRREKQGPQTVVFIALTELGHHNGFFIDLEPGQDVCIDSTAGLVIPPQGGGLGVYVCLSL